MVGDVHPRLVPSRARAILQRIVPAASVAWLALGILLAPRAGAEADQVAPRADVPVNLAGADLTRLRLQRETPPARDEVALARQFRGTCNDPVPTPVPMWQPASVGERRAFRVLDERRKTYVDAKATLKGVSDRLLIYVQDGVNVTPEAIASSMEAFTEVTLPALEATFGPMPTPGRVTVFSGVVPGVGGYFSSSDLVPLSLSPNSNERVMVYMNSDAHRPGQRSFDGVLAHEVQHFLHWLRHPQQDSWMNEGASELAMAITGHAQAAPVRAYLRRLETPVTGWAERPSDVVPHYGAASLIVRYLGFRAGGIDRLRAIIQVPGVSTQVVDRYLAAPTVDLPRGTPPRPTSFDDLFADFIVATALDDPRVEDGRYAFGSDPFLPERPAPRSRIPVAPGSPSVAEGDLPPYGTHAVHVAMASPGTVADLEVSVDGGATTRAIGADSPDGGTFWWAYPADEVDATLTRTFDLRGETSAALEFDAWYDLEPDYDYAGVALSTDGGCTWRTVAGTDTTEANPVGQNPGAALTGRAGDGEAARWGRMRFDLGAAAGHVAEVRVFQVTDQAFHRAGLAVANLRVVAGPGFASGIGDRWDARGFIETGNRVSVAWAARAIVSGPGGTRVEAIPMRRGEDRRARGSLVVPDFGRGAESVTVVVAPMAPATQMPTDFRVTATAR